MGVSSKDIKKLWGLAAGRCSHPGCGTLCIDFVADEPIIIGEMAHVIARRPAGRRGIPGGGEESYDNLILLCPTHHTMIDKSTEGTFTANDLLAWKTIHEDNVADTLASPAFRTINEVAKYIQKLLIENRTTWETYGPESVEATTNPLSNLVRLWTFRKLDTIIPNNLRIIESIQRHKILFDDESYNLACAFYEHAKGFESSCYNRLEGIPRFPQQFAKMVTAHAEQE